MAKEDTPTKAADVVSSPVGNDRISITENPGAKITTTLLNGDNYLSWFQSVRSGLRAGQNLGIWMVRSRFLVKKILLVPSEKLIIIL